MSTSIVIHHTVPARCKRAAPFGNLLCRHHIITVHFNELSMHMGCLHFPCPHKVYKTLDFKCNQFSKTVTMFNCHSCTPSAHMPQITWPSSNYMTMNIKPSVIYRCPRRNVPNFGRVFLILNYTDITQNTYIQSWTVTEIMAIEKCGLRACSMHCTWYMTSESTALTPRQADGAPARWDHAFLNQRSLALHFHTSS